MRPLVAIIFISVLLTVLTSTVKQSTLEKQKSQDRKIEESNIQKTLLNKNKNISTNVPPQSPRLLQTIQALNNFISSLSGQLYFPVSGGFNSYGTSNSQSTDLGAQLLNSVPTPPQFNLDTPQSITGFGPQASTNTTRQVTFVNAQQILSALGPTNNSSSSVQFNTPTFQQYGQSNNQQRNQNQNQNQQNSQSFWFTEVPQNNVQQSNFQNNQQNQGQTYYRQINLGNTGSRNNNNNNQGATSIDGLNISQLLSSGLSQDQISQILSMQAQILNLPQPVNITDFLRQQQPNTTNTVTTTTTSTSNISSANSNNNFQQIPKNNNQGSYNYSQTTVTNVSANRPIIQQNTTTVNQTTTQSFVQPQPQIQQQTTTQTQTQIQTQTQQNQSQTQANLIASQQAQMATQQLLAQQEAQRQAILQQQQLEQQRQQQLLQQQRQQQLLQQQQQQQQQQTQTTISTTTQQPGQSVILSQQQINRIILAQTRLQSGTNQSATISQTSQTVPSTTSTSNIQATTNIVQTPVRNNITTTTTTVTSSSSQPNAQMCASYASGVCVNCRPGSYLAQGFCYVPVAVQVGCSVLSQSQCIICKSRYYFIQNQCFQVDPRCSNFDYGNKVCVSCTNGTLRRGTGCA